MIQVIRKGKRERWGTLRKEDGGEYRAWTEGSKITMWLKNSQDIIMLPNLKKKNPTRHTSQCTNYNFNELFSSEMMEIQKSLQRPKTI